MKIIGTIIVIVLILLGVFMLVNWDALIAPSHLSFVFYNAEGPIGLIFLGITLLLLILLVSYTLMLRTSMLMETRRHAHELQALRKLADSAESSRFEKLREQLTLEFARMHSANDEILVSLMTRTEGMEQTLLKSLGETTNSLSAHAGEVEEKLDRVLAGFNVQGTVQE